MRLACVADLHGHLPPYDVPEADLLLVAGDVGGDEEFVRDQFGPWLARQPVGEIVGVQGNMDHALLKSQPYTLPWTFLQADSVQISDDAIYGVGFGTTEYLAEALAHVPEDTTILLSHVPPLGYCDLARNGEHAGSAAVLQAALSLPKLKAVVFGHIHEAVGIDRLPTGALVVNCAKTPMRIYLRPSRELDSELYITGTGQQLEVHERTDECMTYGCLIHNPSDHSMREFPTHWRHGGIFDVKPAHMERICPHGTGHPDPDGLAFTRRIYGDEAAHLLAVHGCDGCCAGSYDDV